jgi:hypothetical protein
MRLEIVIVGNAAGALHQAEAARRLRSEAGNLQHRRIFQRPPDALALRGHDLQAVRVVDLVAEVVDARALGFVEQEHRGQRRDADVVERDARETA